MKTFLIALLALSHSALATPLDATEALLTVLPEGIYSGLTYKTQEYCEVTVESTNSGVLVTATSPGKQVDRLVERGTVYRWNQGTREFLSSNRRDENVLRMIANRHDTQYIVVSKSTTVRRQRHEVKIECIVNR